MEQIQDSGIVLKTIPYGSTSQVVTVFSKEHGVVSGYFQGGLKTKGKVGVCNVGNFIDFVWLARVANHLGKIEATTLDNFSTVFATDLFKSAIVEAVCEVLFYTLKESDSHPNLLQHIFELFYNVKKCNNVQCHGLHSNIMKMYVQFEVKLLEELGFGFNFEQCNLSGNAKPEFISPKTGNVVSAQIAKGYEDRLFRIPSFILQPSPQQEPCPAEHHKILANEIKRMMAINLHFLILHLGKREYCLRNFLETLYIKLIAYKREMV